MHGIGDRFNCGGAPCSPYLHPAGQSVCADTACNRGQKVCSKQTYHLVPVHRVHCILWTQWHGGRHSKIEINERQIIAHFPVFIPAILRVSIPELTLTIVSPALEQNNTLKSLLFVPSSFCKCRFKKCLVCPKTSSTNKSCYEMLTF